MAVFTISVLASFAIPFTLANTSPAQAPVMPSQCITAAAGWQTIPSVNTSWSATPIVNAKMMVTNDEAAGRDSYWALQGYQMNLLVWQNTATTPNTFCALSLSSGTWNTYPGAQSPGYNVTEPQAGSGKYLSSNLIAFTGSFFGPYCKSTTRHPCLPGSTEPTTGIVPGKFSLGGTEADVLTHCGNLVCNQVGDSGPIYTNGYAHWYLQFYFTGVLFTTGWNLGSSFTYTYGAIGYGHMWADWTLGDIVT